MNGSGSRWLSQRWTTACWKSNSGKLLYYDTSHVSIINTRTAITTGGSSNGEGHSPGDNEINRRGYDSRLPEDGIGQRFIGQEISESCSYWKPDATINWSLVDSCRSILTPYHTVKSVCQSICLPLCCSMYVCNCLSAFNILVRAIISACHMYTIYICQHIHLLCSMLFHCFTHWWYNCAANIKFNIETIRAMWHRIATLLHACLLHNFFYINLWW